MKCKNFDELSPEDQAFIEEIQYKKQLIRSHSFALGEYEDFSKMNEEERQRKIKELVDK